MSRGLLWDRVVSGVLIAVAVATASRNRIIGDFAEHGALKNMWWSAYVEAYLDKGKPLQPSGLIGPLRLVADKKVTLPNTSDMEINHAR